jgi:hypothetical protein
VVAQEDKPTVAASIAATTHVFLFITLLVSVVNDVELGSKSVPMPFRLLNTLWFLVVGYVFHKMCGVNARSASIYD